MLREQINQRHRPSASGEPHGAGGGSAAQSGDFSGESVGSDDRLVWSAAVGGPECQLEAVC